MDDTPDETLIEIFRRTRTIAVVGFSANPSRPSHYVAEFLQAKGYRVIPVNPGLAGQEFLGERVRASLAEVAEADFVDVFRQTDAVPGVVEEALAHLPGLKTIWMQLGIAHPEAAAQARAAGVTVVQDRCPKIDYPRLAARIRA